MKRCHRCGKEWVSEKRQPAVKEYCDGCSAYLHCCLNCRFYDEHAHNKCRIPTTDWVADRAGCNFCEDFEFASTDKNAKAVEKQDEARHALGQLFGDGGPASSKSPETLDDLFKK